VSDSPEQTTSKKLQAKRARREAEERKAAERKKAQRRRTLVTTGLALGVGALVVALIASQNANRDGGPAVTDIGGPKTAVAAGCTEPEQHEIEGHEHVAEQTTVEYQTDPPTSGDHWPPGSQSNPGFFAIPVENERLVHNLEHGQIVFWYKPDAPEQVKNDLEEITRQPDLSTIAVPYDFDGPGEFAMTSWGWSQSCEQTSQTVIDDFRREHQGHGREPVAPPFEG
jgi:hypothetical protein